MNEEQATVTEARDRQGDLWQRFGTTANEWCALCDEPMSEGWTRGRTYCCDACWEVFYARTDGQEGDEQ